MDLIDALDKFLNSPLINVCQSLYDDYVQANANFRSESGMVEKIVRTTDGNCCEWCSNLAGTYEYHKEPKDVYRRHDNCGCQVTFISEKGYQDVHSKKYLSDTEVEARKERQKIGLSNDIAEKAKVVVRKSVGLDTESVKKKQIENRRKLFG